MALSPVDIGAAPNDGTGDHLRDAFNKLNENDQYLEDIANLAGQAAQQAQDTADAAGQAADEAQADVDTLTVQSAFERDNLRAMLMQSRYGDGPYPTIDWQFAGASRLDPRITFSRPSADTIYDASGKLVTLGTDVPAFPYDPTTGKALGFRVQAQATNLIKGSNVLESAGGRVVTTPKAAIGPFGTMDMFLLQETIDDAEHFALDKYVTNVPGGNKFCFSYFIKDGPSANRTAIIRVAGGAVCQARFDPRAKTIEVVNNTDIGDCGFIEFPDGLFRVWITVNVPSTSTIICRVQLNRDNQNVYVGDGTSGFYASDLQFNAGELTSYIKTDESEATRAADSVVIDGDNFSRWFNPDEGTFLFKLAGNQEAFLMRVKQAGQVWGARYQLGISAVSRAAVSCVDDSLAVNMQISSPTTITGSDTAAFKYKGLDFAVAMNGQMQTGTATALPSNLAQLDILTSGSGTENVMAAMSYFPRALPDAKFLELTA